jgi:hypothetical protein
VQTKAPGGNNSSSFSMESGACSRDSESDTSSRDSESGTNTFDAMLLTSMRRRTVSPATFSLATARRSASRNGDRAASKQPRRPANVASLPMSISMDSGFFSMDSGGGEVQAVARCRCGGEQVQAPQSAGEATSGRAGATGAAARGRGDKWASRCGRRRGARARRRAGEQTIPGRVQSRGRAGAPVLLVQRRGGVGYEAVGAECGPDTNQ